MTGLLIALLSAIAVLHLIWALGVNWPIRDEIALAKAVVGAKGMTRMPPRWASALVACALFGATLLVAMLANLMPVSLPSGLTTVAGWGMVGVFALRGGASYLPVWRRHQEACFDRLNRILYGPLCLLIAVLTVAHI